MSETNTPQLSEKEMEEIVERAVAPSAAPASSDIHPDDAQPLLKITHFFKCSHVIFIH